MRTIEEVINELLKVGNHKCEHCGANICSIDHSLSPGLVRSLKKFAEAVKRNKKNQAHLQKDCSLTHNEYNNFQKLGYFGLAAKHKDKTGYWVLTRRGGAFLRNELVIRKGVTTFRDFKIKDFGDEVKISDYYNNDLYPHEYWQTTFNMKIEQGLLL